MLRRRSDTGSVPFNSPKLSGRELAHIKDAIRRGQLSGDGHYTRLCEARLEATSGAAKCLLTHSCTAALEMAALLCDLKQGDEVIMPSFTFVSTANAVCLRGAAPVFADIASETLNIDPVKVEEAITEKTRAIFAIHYAGVICDMDELRDIADRHGLFLVADAAQALGATYKSRPAGACGDIAAFSFHETKNVICGEGGFIGINTPSLFERAEIIREKGTNRRQFHRGFVDKYTWIDIGSSFLPGELVAAFLYGQLENAEAINAWRKALWNRYDETLRPQAQALRIALPGIPRHCEHNGHMYYLILDSPEERASFIAHMKSRNIMTPFHYVPLHSAPAGRRFGRVSGSLAVTEHVSERLVRLPLFTMNFATQDRVIDAILERRRP
jgi:dTDP-4-amino-4,6-dideoxygalactose transaminase